jgi:hypothetical protein
VRDDAPFLAEGLEAPNYSWKTDYFAAAGRQRHLLQLQRADELVGQMLRQLDDLDRYDDSLVVVTADHGVAFDAGQPIRGLSESNAEQIMWVPLFVKAPHQRAGEVNDQPMQTIDVFPTIADLIGMDIPWPVDGRPGSAPRTEADDTRRFYPWKLNELVPASGEDYVKVDGEAGFRAVFDVEPPGNEPRDDLQMYRFGPWGSLVGQETSSLTIGDDSSISVELRDANENGVGPDHFDITAGQQIVPVYVRGVLDEVPAPQAASPPDLLVGVNGFVGGWARPFRKDGATQFFSLTPHQLFADGPNEIQVYELTGDPEHAVLHPVTIEWSD